jgi:hypothetical protein
MSLISAVTFRTQGDATSSQNLFVLFNAGTNRIVQIRRIVLQIDPVGTLVTTMPIFKLCRIYSYSGGQALTKVNWGTVTTHSDIQARGRNTSDGGGQTNIVATVTETMWQQYGSRMASTAGQVLGEDQNIAPLTISDNPIILRQNQGILVYIESVAGTSNPNTNHYFVQCAWGEI